VTQLAAEASARQQASADLARQLQESEGRCAALSEQLAEVREDLEHQRAAADAREEALQQVGEGSTLSGSVAL
jgi:predicted  nucleic acid-binding Zn-ribbon protein